MRTYQIKLVHTNGTIEFDSVRAYDLDDAREAAGEVAAEWGADWRVAGVSR